MAVSSYVSIALSILCIVISLIVLICLLLERDRRSNLTRFFGYLIISNIGIIASDVVAYIVDGKTGLFAFYAVRVSNFLHYSFGALILATMTFYILAHLDLKVRIPQRLRDAVLSLCALSLILTVVSQFSGIYYYIDEFNVYHRGDVFWLSQILPMVGMLMNMVIVLYYRKVFERKFLVFFLAYMILPMSALCLALIYYGITFINIATTLSALILYIGVQTEHTRNMSLRIRDMDIQQELQGEHYKMLRNHIDETRRARHDLRHHLSVFLSFIDKGETGKLVDYINEYQASLPEDTGITFCENYAVNSILSYYVGIAKKEGINVTVHTELPEKTGVSDTDLCIVFGNCVENAIEACRNVTENRFITINSETIGDMLSVTVDNSFDGELTKKGDVFLSRKHDGGIGISSVRIVAHKYNGEARFKVSGNVFQASVLLLIAE